MQELFSYRRKDGVIIFENVDKFALKKINIHIPKGLTVGLLGESGSGKSTFLRLCAGNLEPESGCIYVGNAKSRTCGKKKGRTFGILMDRATNIQSDLSARDNLESLKYFYQIEDEDFKSRYQIFSEELGFAEYENKKIRDLSLGQKRRVEIAAAFFHNPDIILLDEPTTGLDVNGKGKMQEFIRKREEQGLTTVIASQDVNEICDSCSRVCVLEEGRIAFWGSKDMLLKIFNPIETMQLVIQGALPDLADLPIQFYSIDDQTVTLIYDSRVIRSSEILSILIPTIHIREMTIRKPSIRDIMMKGMSTNESKQLY